MMHKANPLESFLSMELHHITENAPEELKEAIFHAVFPGGGRVRPSLSLEVVRTHGVAVGNAALAAAAAVELIHCASLVHDDMPCFDNADMRRGIPSVHKKYGERIALLTGDGLIAAAFEVLARHAAAHPRFGEMVRVLANATGASDGLVSGQAWEDQENTAVETVHDRKTGALFEAATVLGALIVFTDPKPWRALGKALGSAYQAADDILDAAGRSDLAGKPVLQDQGRDVTSLVTSVGLRPAVNRFHALAEDAAAAVPSCPGREGLVHMVREIAARLCPPSLTAATRREESVHHEETAVYSRASV